MSNWETIDYSYGVKFQQMGEFLVGRRIVSVLPEDETYPHPIGFQLVFDDGSRMKVGYETHEGEITLGIKRDA